MHPAVRSQLGNSVSLSAFMKEFSQKEGLSKTDRLRLVEQALVLLEMNYVHLPLKRAIHAIDPIRRLELLKFTLQEMNEHELPSEMQFHDAMETIFTSTRDLHTNYLLPEPFNQKTAYLPFLVEEYFEGNGRERKFLVSHLADWFPEHQTFKKGVEVLYWNGMQIRRAIEINGESQAGSNLEARFARGLDALTIRPLMCSLPPDEEWVVITHRSPDGPTDIVLRWQVFEPQPDGKAVPGRLRASALGLDIKKAAINETRKILFAPAAVQARKRTVGARTRASAQPFRDWAEVEESRLPSTFRAWKVETGHGTFAYIRIFSFQTANNRAGTVRFVGEFRRLIEALPQTGLIIDVRGNGGGNINAGEQILQLLTPRQIKPELFEMINTPLNLKISRVDRELRIWKDSLKEAALTGASYSHGFPVTSEKSCNEIGQIYYGPVVLITDALCYSTTDMFAAGFQDHGIGEILGTSGNTGAGGANVWEHGFLRASLSRSANSPFKPLPNGAGMRVAFRRSIRVGDLSGTAGRPLEELGVIPKLRHYMTSNDLLHDNRDLISEAAEILASKKVYGLSARVYFKRDGTLTVSASTKDLSRLDLYIDDCPIGACRVVSNKAKFEKVSLRGSGSKAGRILVLKGFERNKLVAAFRKKLSLGSRRRSAHPR
jgi:C-terminal processing protease CtpA/Prc